MKKILIGFFILIIVFLVGCSHTNDSQTTSKVPASGSEGIKESVVVGDEKETSKTEVKEFNVVAKQWEFDPNPIIVNKGDRIKLDIKSIDVAHGFALPAFGINSRLNPGETATVEFVADKSGTFSFFCSVYCGSGHPDMKGTLIVNE